MQISPVCFSMSPSPVHAGNSLKSSSRIDTSVDGTGRPMVPSHGCAQRHGSRQWRGLGQAVGFGETVPGHLLPALGHRLLHGGAAADHHLERGKIELLEARRVSAGH
jgi:hypothetical protein